MIDRVAADNGIKVFETPVGFKWFVAPLINAEVFFGGEESAGASFLRKDGKVWSTDKDGMILALLSAEILAKTGKDPGEHYIEMTKKFGAPIYARMDAVANYEQKKILKNLSPSDIKRIVRRKKKTGNSGKLNKRVEEKRNRDKIDKQKKTKIKDVS